MTIWLLRFQGLCAGGKNKRGAFIPDVRVHGLWKSRLKLGWRVRNSRVSNFIKTEALATLAQNYGLKDDWYQYWQVSNFTGVENHKKLLSLLNSPPWLCAEYEISSKLKHLPFFIQNWPERWQLPTLAGVKNHRKLLSSMNSATSNCSLCKILWKMVNLIPRSPFPILRSPFPVLRSPFSR